MADARQSAAEQITRALMDLMAEKPFADITVTDVVRRAGVARASFYRNFASTSDILDRIMDEFVTVFKDYALPVLTSKDERQWRAFLFRFLYFVSERGETLILSKNTNVDLFFYRLGEAAHELAAAVHFSDLKEKYDVSARIGAINSVLVHWVGEGRAETPEEIVDYLMSFILLI